MSRRWTALLAAILLLVSGCSLLQGDDPADDAEAFAGALAEGDLRGVRVVGRTGAEAREWWRGVRDGMGESTLAVDVADVTEAHDGRAEATLRHVWTLAGATDAEWGYETTVPMVRRDDVWAFELGPAAVVPGLRDDERLELSSVAPKRGDILDGEGRPIVTDRPVVRLGIDKTQLPPGRQAASARALATLLDLDPDEYAERVKAAGEKAYVEAIVLRKEDVTPAIGRGMSRISGVGVIADELPLAPTREFARPILGTVGEATAEMIEKSEGRLAVGDVAGLSGLQQRYDEQLRGVPGVVVEAVHEETGEARTLHEIEPQDGEPLRTTLDVDMQGQAEDALAGLEPASAVVALRPSTGEILAAASGAGSEGYSTATVGQYAPGSTFKVVTSLALLRAGLSPANRVQCPPTVTVDGKQFKNYSDYPATALGEITLREALAHSCNTAFVSQHDRIGPEQLADAAAALGLGRDHDIGFPAYFGQVPADGTGTEHAAALIGQGKVLASPMAMAAVAGSVAAGTTVVPHLVPEAKSTAEPESPLTQEEARQLRELMAAVVEEGSGRLLADLPGQVLAKTGTAEFGDQVPPQTHAWMIAVRGDLAVAAFVEVGESGSRTAGPVLKQFLSRVG